MEGAYQVLVCIVLLGAVAQAQPKSHSRISIPSDAKPGHIVTLLPFTAGQSYSLRHPENGALSQYFNVMDQGHLVTDSDISQLTGSSVALHVEHELPTGVELQVLDLDVVPVAGALHFDGQPYTLHIPENQPVGTRVSGMDQLQTVLKSFPPHTQYSLVAGDLDAFKLHVDNGGISVTSLVPFDREDKSCYHLTLKAAGDSGSEAFAMLNIDVDDVNDNMPSFEKEVFFGNLMMDAPIDTSILKLFASDPDYEDEIIFRIEDNDLIGIDQTTATVVVKNMPAERPMESVEVEVRAVDKAGAESEPAWIRVETVPLSSHRSKRQTETADMSFVLNVTASGELFSVAGEVEDPNMRYTLLSTTTGFNMNVLTGMVSLISGTLGDLDMDLITFNVNFSNVQTSTWEQLTIDLHVITRGLFDPIFVTEPQPLKAMVPLWIRPYELLLTLVAIDKIQYEADVRYRLETGWDGRFIVDAMTGELRTFGRAEYDCPVGQPYQLAISAQTVGVPELETATPSQVVEVYCEELPPQFYQPYYNISTDELSTQPLSEVIRAKSFFDIPLEYTMVAAGDGALNYSLNIDTGVLTPLRPLSYVFDKRREVMMVTANEPGSSPYSTTTELIINLVDTNNYSPEFPASVYVPDGYIQEDVTEGTPILQERPGIRAVALDRWSLFTVSIVDLDSGILGEATFTVDNSLFEVEQNADKKSGTLKTVGRLDYDFLPNRMYEFTVTATDGGTPPNTGTATIRIPMANVNDEEPVFTPQNVQTVVVKQSALAGTLVHVIQAYDPDGQPLTFEFLAPRTSSTRSSRFILDRSTGFISLFEGVPEIEDPYTLNVRASDGTMYTDAQIVVTYVGVNRRPQFEECASYNLSPLKEGQPPNTTVVTVTATDPDQSSESGKMDVFMVYDYYQYFDVRAVNENGLGPWEVFSLAEFDRESPLDGHEIVSGRIVYPVTIRVTDRDLRQPLSATCFFFVAIEDINDQTPEFDGTEYSTTILQSLGMHQRVLRVFAYDKDEGLNAVVDYTIQSTTPNCNCLAVDPTSGWLTVSSAISDEVSVITMTVRATDRGVPSRSSTVEVTVTLTSDPSMLPPIWLTYFGQIDDNPIEIDEDFPQDEFLPNWIYRTDSPTGSDVNYFITRGNTLAQNNDQSFDARTNGNEITIEVRKPLNYEETPWYILQIRASYLDSSMADLRSISRLNVTLRDVNDNSPEFIGLSDDGNFPAAVADNSPIATLTTTIFAVDYDGTSPNNKVSYYFDDSCGTDCESFQINQDSGEIHTTTTFNRNDQSQYILRVVARDGEESWVNENKTRRSTNVKPVTVTITGASSNPPEFEQPNYFAGYDEGLAIGEYITMVTATTPDDENIPQYDIIGGNPLGMFAVSKTEGSISAYGFLNYDSSPYILRYRSFDGITEDITNITLSITEQNIFYPIFSPGVYTSVDIREESAGDTVITQVTATDPDGSVNLAYGLDGMFYTEDTSRFSIDSSGVVMVREALSRDYPNGHANWQFNPTAEDSGSPRKKGYGVVNLRLVDINNNPPVFDTCCLRGGVLENAVGQNALEVFAVDYDDGDNALVRYRITGNPTLNGVGIFAINDASRGLITNVVSLDRETQDIYEVVIEAYDNPTNGDPSLSTEITIIIDVYDDNDHDPEFPVSSYFFTIPEDLAVGDVVGVVSAVDEDLEYNALRTYSILDTDLFYMDSIYQAGTGAIKVKEELDYEQLASPLIDFRVQVQGPRSSQTHLVSVTVNVTNVNDQAPEINMPSNPIDVPETADIGYTVVTLTAVDPDVGSTQEFDWYIDYENSDPEQYFAVEGDGGNGCEVKVFNELQWEPPSGLQELTILAVDSGWPRQTGTGTLTIAIQDYNTNAPRLVIPDEMLVVRNNPQVGTLVASLTIEDDDSDENSLPFYVGQCQYTEPQFGCSYFNQEVDGDQLLIKTRSTQAYDRDVLNINEFTLPVVLWDSPSANRGPALTSTTEVTIVIADSNTHRHEAGTKHITVYNYNEEFANINLGHVYVNDADDWDRHDKVYQLLNHASYFDIRDYGDIYMLEYVPAGTYTLTVQVTDDKWSPSTVDSTVIVDVIPINDTAVRSSGSMRLQGLTADEFVSTSSPSKLQLLRAKLATLLETLEEYVEIFTVRDVPDIEEDMVDVRFAAHGSPYYRSARLDGIVWSNKASIESDVGVSIVMSPVNECPEAACWSEGCTNSLVTTNEPLLVNTNETSLVGVTAYVVAECTCGARDFDDITENPQTCDVMSCLNGGTCHETWADTYCECPRGFDGPRCQQLRHSFSGNGWAWYAPLEQCDLDSLSIDFATSRATGLILYNGPWYNSDSPDFLSLELVNGYPKVRANFGGGEVTLTLDGRDSNGQERLGQLNDGRWHTVQIFKQSTNLSLVVDYCAASIIVEDIDFTSEDRAACESSATVPGFQIVMNTLNLLTPLELGGRSHPSIPVPSGLTNTGFEGCLKNLRHNGVLYDLHIGGPEDQVGEHLNTEDGCPAEDEVCLSCTGNSTCVAGLGGTPVCTCLPGYRYGGSECTATQEKNFETEESYMEWQLSSSYNNSNPADESEIQLMFRTRQVDGLIFSTPSFTTLERLRIEIANSHLSARFDLGADDRLLTLAHVNVSDGIWHTVNLYRRGNYVVLKLDGGEGRYYNEMLAVDEHRLILLYGQQLVAGADVVYKPYHDGPTVSNSFHDSCINDVRHNTRWFPMVISENSDHPNAQLVKDVDTVEGCNSTACLGVICASPLMCLDAWRMGLCLCPPDQFPVDTGEVCLAPCANHQCVHGTCIPNRDGSYECECHEGYTGFNCNAAAATAVGVTDATIVIIVICFLILLILLILGLLLYRYTNKRTPYLLEVDDDDIRENVVFYNEEGAGEEDMLSYDITRLQKPVDPDADSMHKGPMDDPIRRREMPLSREPEPMLLNRYPNIGPDGKYPNIGDFIGDRMGDADLDPTAPPYDSVREYQYEGSGSTAGSLSSLNSSSSGGDQDYDYLNQWGPRFSKLAELYGGGGEDDEDASSV